MATFETKLLDENGLFHRTALSDEIEAATILFAQRIIDISKRENFSLVEINLLESHVGMVLGNEFAEHRLRTGMEIHKAQSTLAKARMERQKS